MGWVNPAEHVMDYHGTSIELIILQMLASYSKNC